MQILCQYIIRGVDSGGLARKCGVGASLEVHGEKYFLAHIIILTIVVKISSHLCIIKRKRIACRT